MDCTKVIENVKESIPIIIVELENERIGTGTGFIYMEENIVVTCNHVVDDAKKIFVKFPNKEATSAEIIIKDLQHDIALLKINSSGHTPLKTSDQDVKEGMPVIFSGYPLQMAHLTTHIGIISSIAKDATGLTTYVIDGTVNPGNSGCPLMDSKGQVIGVVNATRRESNDLLKRIEETPSGLLTYMGIDIISAYQSIIKNLQLGIGYSVPAAYIPTHKKLTRKTKSFKEK